MRIEPPSLDGGKGRFSHSYSAGELVLEDEGVRLLAGPEVSGEVRTVERRVKVSGHVTATVTVECDRCLKLIELPVNSNFAVDYVTESDYQAQPDTELSEADLDLTVFDGEAIDIDALVAEEVLLAIPDHRLCGDNCKGICLRCGADRNVKDCGCENDEIDPRWAGLKELVHDKS